LGAASPKKLPLNFPSSRLPAISSAPCSEWVGRVGVWGDAAQLGGGNQAYPPIQGIRESQAYAGSTPSMNRTVLTTKTELVSSVSSSNETAR
jgi:hypothetical protein